MNRTITAITDALLTPALDMVERTFTESDSADEGRMVRALVEEMRQSPWHLPELELLMLDDQGVAGFVKFTRFALDGQFSDRLLLLSPVATRTDVQRQGVSRELIEHGFLVAQAMGFTAVIVEGNPANYRARGFRASAAFGVTAHESVHLPHPDCLMLRELTPGGAQGITGQVRYDMYKTLS